MGRRAKGTGYLITNSDGTKTLRKAVKDPASGKHVRIQVTAASETACVRKMNARLREIEEQRNNVCVNPNMTVVQLCKNHLNHKLTKEIVKLTSRDRIEVTIKNQIENSTLGHMQVGTVTPRDVNDFFTNMVAAKKLSVSSMEKVLFVLDPAFKWAVSLKELGFNPIDTIRDDIIHTFSELKKTDADDVDVVHLSKEEKTKIWEVASEKLPDGSYKYLGGIHFRFLVESGLRVGEWIALRWEDYNFDENILRIEKCRHQVKVDLNDTKSNSNYRAHEGNTKNKKARNLILTKKAREILLELYELTPYKDPKDYICLTSNKTNYTATTMENIVKTVYRNAGVDDHVSGLHILRRTFATELFRKGFTVMKVAEYLGDLESTVSKYYIAARDVKEIKGERIAVVDLGEE